MRCRHRVAAQGEVGWATAVRGRHVLVKPWHRWWLLWSALGPRVEPHVGCHVLVIHLLVPGLLLFHLALLLFVLLHLCLERPAILVLSTSTLLSRVCRALPRLIIGVQSTAWVGSLQVPASEAAVRRAGPLTARLRLVLIVSWGWHKLTTRWRRKAAHRRCATWGGWSSHKTARRLLVGC